MSFHIHINRTQWVKIDKLFQLYFDRLFIPGHPKRKTSHFIIFASGTAMSLTVLVTVDPVYHWTFDLDVIIIIIDKHHVTYILT